MSYWIVLIFVRCSLDLTPSRARVSLHLIKLFIQWEKKESFIDSNSTEINEFIIINLSYFFFLFINGKKTQRSVLFCVWIDVLSRSVFSVCVNEWKRGFRARNVQSAIFFFFTSSLCRCRCWRQIFFLIFFFCCSISMEICVFFFLPPCPIQTLRGCRI